MTKERREKLTEIIEAEGGKRWWVPEEFEAHVRTLLDPELQIIAPPPSYSGNYNCFVFAFRLESDREFLGGQNPIHSEFVKRLFDKGILRPIDSPHSGSLIFYEDSEGVITHGGIMQNEQKVISKWMWGATIAHEVYDTPSSFGDKIVFCEGVPSALVKQEYEEYKKSGAEIRPIA